MEEFHLPIPQRNCDGYVLSRRRGRLLGQVDTRRTVLFPDSAMQPGQGCFDLRYERQRIR